MSTQEWDEKFKELSTSKDIANVNYRSLADKWLHNDSPPMGKEAYEELLSASKTQDRANQDFINFIYNKA
jgi:hypothetical protein